MILKIEASRVFKEIRKSNSRIIALQGGTRSTKTYSVLQEIIVKCYEESGYIYTIIRKWFNTLKSTAMRDFLDILNAYEIYNPALHDKVAHTYELNGNLIEFQGLDRQEKKHGAKRDYLFVNEAPELTLEEWRQLIYRTAKQIYIDYNPHYEHHWIYDHVLTRNDVTFIKSTYKDNKFLPQEIIDEIERMKTEDENHWRIYGLGERGRSPHRVYKDYNIIPLHRYPQEWDDQVYGLDFGFNNPTVLLMYGIKDNVPYAHEIIYQTKLTNTDLIVLMGELGVSKSVPIYADHEPNRIKEIELAGYNIYKADKDREGGIDHIKGIRIFSHPGNVNLNKERTMYSHKVNANGKIIDDEIVRFNDHAMDAERYALYTRYIDMITDKKQPLNFR